jgi:hypothetical protein
MLEPFIEPTEKSVADFISEIDATKRQLDAQLLQQLMTRVSGHEAVVWGEGVIGFGSFKNTHKTGRTWDWPVISYALEPGRLVVYAMTGFDNLERSLKQLGKNKISSHCLYIKTLSDVDMNVLESLVTTVYKEMSEKYECQ